MVLRFFSARHSLSVPTGTALTFLTPPVGGDIRGNDRILIGVRTQAGADAQRVRVTSPDWGPRQRQFPPLGQGGAVAGMRTTWLEYPEMLQKNQVARVAATHDNVGAQVQTYDLLYIEFGDNELPAGLLGTVGKGHDMFITGIAFNGSMPAIPTASQRMEQDSGTIWWPTAMAGQGVGIPNIQITYPESDGQGPQAPANSDVLQESMFTRVAPLQQINNGDTVDLFAEDQSGGSINAWIQFQMSMNGALPAARFAPPFGTFP